jgi:phenylpropionate dioxygenase-like ring-hydroxylating dioxygenase large terminal subunit
MNQDISVKDLVKEDAVHRRVYVDPAIFQMEMDRIFSKAWIYIGHESEIVEAGCFVRARIGNRDILLVRDAEEHIRAFLNRCPHRGSQICRSQNGQVKFFRCPYHDWSFRTDGNLLNIPHVDGYGPDFDSSDPAHALVALPRLESYRGFIFASLASDGPDLADYLGPMTLPFDNMTDRAPLGEIELQKNRFRQTFKGNWKFHMENATDLIHPVRVHESAIEAARTLTGSAQINDSDPEPIQMMKSNGIAFDNWDAVGVHAYDRGHGYMGSFYSEGSIASSRSDPVFMTYKAMLVDRLGSERAEEVLGISRFNNLIYPNLSLNANFQQIRVIHPVAVDRTVVESGCFRLKGAPEALFQTAIRFLSTANSPASLISSDDLEIFERCQIGIMNDGTDWLDLSRGRGQEDSGEDNSMLAKGTSELTMRNQLKAWLSYMQDSN